VIRERIRNLRDVPTLPVVITKLINILKNDNASVQDLAEVIRRDQALASRIVGVANSPFFGFRGKINSVEQAVLMLGFDLLKSIALSVSIFSFFPIPYPMLKKMWSHSYQVGLLAGFLGARIPGGSAGVCFLGGLLHDVGRAVFISFPDIGPLAEQVKGLPSKRADELLRAETDLFECTHAEAGRWFLEDLCFPEEILLPVNHHHRIGHESGHQAVVTAVFLAEGITGLANTNGQTDGEWGEEQKAVFDRHGFSEDDLREIRLFLLREAAAADNYFGN